MSGPVAAGDPVIDFVLTGLDGRTYDLGAARAAGDAVLYMIYKAGCGTCRLAFPFIQRLHDQYAGPGFQVWAVSQDDPEQTAEFARTQGATLPILLDADLAVTEAHRLTNVPAIYLVDASDRIVRHSAAFVKAELNAMARMAAHRTGRPFQPIVRDEDDAPDFRPG